MKNKLITSKTLVIIFLVMILLTVCDSVKKSVNENDEDINDNIYDVETNGIPKFVDTDYIELNKIYRISKFRSGIGHDYSDDFETCRSMKHYFQPKTSVNWSAVKIYSPVRGTVSQMDEGWAGTQVRIRSEEYPAFYFILFHVNLNNSLEVDDQIVAGQELGTHIGSQTMSDIAVGINTPDGWKLVSFFNAMTDSIFQRYQARGLSSRNDVIISQPARDADLLTCDGEDFINNSTLENWVFLD